MKRIFLCVVACLAIGIAASFLAPVQRAFAQSNLGLPDGILKFTTTQGSTTGSKVASDFVIGRATLVAGVVTVSTTKATATANIFPHRQTIGGTKGVSYEITRSAGVSFTITALKTDNTTETADTSVVAYEIVEP